MKKIVKFLNSSIFIISFAFIINFLFIFLLTKYLKSYYYVYSILSLISLLISLYFMSKNNDDPIYKLSWFVLIIFLPILGTFLFFYLKAIKRKKLNIWNKNFKEQINFENTNNINNISSFVYNSTGYPVYNNSKIDYFDSGKKFFEKLKSDLLNAKKYIFLEFFIIKEGVLWQEILEILLKKAKENVEIRVLYDDVGSLNRLNKKKIKKLTNNNFVFKPFNKLNLSINLFMNFRNHRKLIIIDGITAYTGGVNIADEYANINNKYYWKDNAVLLKGDCIKSLLVMFLNDWNNKEVSNDIINKYYKNYNYKYNYSLQPFGINPIFSENIARDFYIQLLSFAKKKIDITTPYLILDNYIVNTIKILITSGTKINIYIPGKPDKKRIYYLTLMNAELLVKLGVNVYIYEKGFLHQKIALVDEKISIVGTINLDFRSLYLHFENAVISYNNLSFNKKLQDDIKNIKLRSSLATNNIFKNLSFFKKFIAKFLKLFEQIL